MTATRARLRRLGRPHVWARAGAAGLEGVGAVAVIVTAGAWSTPRLGVIGAAWIAIAVVAAAAARAVWRAARTARPRTLAPIVEIVARARAGSVSGALEATRRGSAALVALADERAGRAVAVADADVRHELWVDTGRRLARGVVSAGLGMGAFLIVSPAHASAFWHPFRTLADARAPIRLELDRDHVRRGEFVNVTIHAPAAPSAVLWVRGPGEPWRLLPIALDSGSGAHRLGPLDGDLYVRATSGSRTSDKRRVVVALPAFLAKLDLTARFPRYLEQADEQLTAGPDTVPLAAGTVVLTSGAASVTLSRAAWENHDGGRNEVVSLACQGPTFEGRFAPRTSGAWHLDLRAADGAPLEGGTPELDLRVVPDSAPVVLLPVPGHDGTLPLSLHQPLVIDAHDDHAVTRVELVSWRVSQTGKEAEPVRAPLAIGPASDRVLIETELDATHRGLLPGDTLRLQVVAWDNAPVPQEGKSPEIALLLPSLSALRAATRGAARSLGDTVSSLAQAAAALADRTRDLAAQRARGQSGAVAAPPQPGALPFDASERAAAVAHDQADLQQRAERLVQAVDELARAAEAAGLHDSAFGARLEDVRRLLQRALTPELAQRLRELQAAVAQLDPQATRDALDRLAAAEQQFRQALDRSQALFQRAAVEGALASLADDAEDLERRQGHWNKTDGPRPDSAAATRERALATSGDSLALGIAQATKDLAATDGVESTPPLARSSVAADQARTAMRGAARAADVANALATLREGQAAESELAEIPGLLRERRDSLTAAWRQETVAALDRALDESVDLARREQAVVDSLRHGDASPGLRGRQASLEEGTGAILHQIQEAAARHALVSPQLAGVVGFAERQMGAARAQLEEATPNVDAGASLAEQSVDALNATAYALVRTRDDVAGAQSGTGFAEALAQLARLAQQQGSLNAQAQGLLPLALGAGPAIQDQLRALAAEQRALADQLDRIRASGGSDPTGALGDEARALASQLEAGRLDAQTVQRQARLYHRLLDAGRTLSSPEPDPDRERVSHSALGDSVHVPLPLGPGATGLGPAVRYPTWEDLRGLTPDERRLVLEYFQRLNAPPPR